MVGNPDIYKWAISKFIRTDGLTDYVVFLKTSFMEAGWDGGYCVIFRRKEAKNTQPQ